MKAQIGPPYNKPTLEGLDSITIEIPDAVFKDIDVGDEFTVKVTELAMLTTHTTPLKNLRKP